MGIVRTPEEIFDNLKNIEAQKIKLMAELNKSLTVDRIKETYAGARAFKTIVPLLGETYSIEFIKKDPNILLPVFVLRHIIKDKQGIKVSANYDGYNEEKIDLIQKLNKHSQQQYNNIVVLEIKVL